MSHQLTGGDALSSQLWTFRAKCRVFVAPQPSLDLNVLSPWAEMGQMLLVQAQQELELEQDHPEGEPMAA